MRTITIFAVLILLAPALFAQSEQDASSIRTEYYFIRHAEKDSSSTDPNNPGLSELGQQRAENLVDVFRGVEFDAIYATKYLRSLATGAPLASYLDISITLYDPFGIDMNLFTSETLGKKILIIGHSNTIPELVNAIIGTDEYPDMKEFEFNSIYKVIRIGSYTSHKLLKLN